MPIEKFDPRRPRDDSDLRQINIPKPAWEYTGPTDSIAHLTGILLSRNHALLSQLQSKDPEKGLLYRQTHVAFRSYIQSLHERIHNPGVSERNKIQTEEQLDKLLTLSSFRKNLRKKLWYRQARQNRLITRRQDKFEQQKMRDSAEEDKEVAELDRQIETVNKQIATLRNVFIFLSQTSEDYQI